MSTASKAVLGGAILFTTAIVYGVHYQQTKEREDMYKGVIRDEKRRADKMRRREEELQESLRKRKLYEQYQTVSTESTSTSTPTK